jgi:predicted acylesterase/phospholipase RssA
MKRQLCISGGGIRGLAFLGALYELFDSLQTYEVCTISGTSIGAFIAACLLVGYTTEELLDYFFVYDFQSLKDIDIKYLYTHKCLMRGQRIHDFYRTTLGRKVVSPDISLKQLFEQTQIKFIVAVTCMNTQSIEYISHETHPDISLHLLICMTTAIPGILPPISYNGKLYVDGAMIDNIPTSVLDHDLPADVIVTNNKTPPLIDNHQFTFFTFFSTLLRIIYQNHRKQDQSDQWTFYKIDASDVSVTSFNITPDDKFKLIYRGRQSVKS